MPSRRAVPIDQAATYLGISKYKLYRMAKGGIGPRFIRSGRKFLYFIDDLEDYLHDNLLAPRHPAAPIPPKDTRPARPLTDAEWQAIAHIVPSDARGFIDAVLYIVWTNRPWHMLPLEYGNHRAVQLRFRRWGEQGLWQPIFAALANDPAFPYRFIQRDSICVANLAAEGRQQTMGYMLDCDQRTTGPYPVPFRTQRRLKVRKWPTLAEWQQPDNIAKEAGRFKRR